MITLVWAQTKDGIIGKDGKLPWSIKEEMEHFKAYTKDKPILMGRKTWLSLPVKPLKGRINYVASRQEIDLSMYENTIVIRDLYDFLEEWAPKDEELVVIGGSVVFEVAQSFANKMIVSIIKQDYDGDDKICNINYNHFNEVDVRKFDEFTIHYYEEELKYGK